MNTTDFKAPRRGIGRSAWALAGLLAIAAYFLLSEHRAHFLSYLPFVLLAACPLLHLFHGHGGQGGHGSAACGPRGREAPAGAPPQRPPGDEG